MTRRSVWLMFAALSIVKVLLGWSTPGDEIVDLGVIACALGAHWSFNRGAVQQKGE